MNWWTLAALFLAVWLLVCVFVLIDRRHEVRDLQRDYDDVLAELITVQGQLGTYQQWTYNHLEEIFGDVPGGER